MTIYNVSIQVGLLEFLKLMIGILQYQPSSEKIFSLDVSSMQLNELVFIRNPIIFPKIYSEINPLQIPKEKSKSDARINPLILQLHGLFYILQLHRLFYIWQLHRLFYILQLHRLFYILQLHRLFYIWQATSYLHWNAIRKFQTGLAFGNLHPWKSQLRSLLATVVLFPPTLWRLTWRRSFLEID